jgi:hypothetical protein
MRVFLAIEISGEFNRLKRALVNLGHQVTFFDKAQHAFEYGGLDQTPEILSKLIANEPLREWSWYQLREYRGRFSWNHLFKVIVQKLWLVRNIFWFCCFASRYDVFAFNYANSLHLRNKLLKFNDLFWLRLLRKTIVFRISGCEARPVYLDGAQFMNMTDPSPQDIVNETKMTRENNRALEKYASYVIANEYTSYFFHHPVIPLQLVGRPMYVPIDSNGLQTPRSADDESVVVLHAPSRTDAKNTSEITAIVGELKNEGLKIDFRVVTGRPNREVISEIGNCDFVIDQMYSDLALSSFAAEAAYFGKPAVVGGYLTHEELKVAHKHFGVPPSEFCHPTKMKDAIRRLVTDEVYRRKLGENAQCFVHTVWSPEAVAERWVRLFRHDVPADWFWNPAEQEICPPVCISEAKAGELINNIVVECGESALCLDDKPLLRRSVLALASAQRTLATTNKHSN